MPPIPRKKPAKRNNKRVSNSTVKKKPRKSITTTRGKPDRIKLSARRPAKRSKVRKQSRKGSLKSKKSQGVVKYLRTRKAGTTRTTRYKAVAKTIHRAKQLPFTKAAYKRAILEAQIPNKERIKAYEAALKQSRKSKSKGIKSEYTKNLRKIAKKNKKLYVSSALRYRDSDGNLHYRSVKHTRLVSPDEQTVDQAIDSIFSDMEQMISEYLNSVLAPQQIEATEIDYWEPTED